MKVLILEDDHLLGQVYCDALSDAGHIVDAAQTNAEAIALLANGLYELLIFDLMINGETSIPVLDFANYASPGAEVILVTGSGLFSRGEMQCRDSSVSFRLQKPIKLSDLVELVAHFERTQAKIRHSTETKERISA